MSHGNYKKVETYFPQRMKFLFYHPCNTKLLTVTDCQICEFFLP